MLGVRVVSHVKVKNIKDNLKYYYDRKEKITNSKNKLLWKKISVFCKPAVSKTVLYQPNIS